jgi:glycosyltransferase involved in cell wall biosynthesis
VGAAPYADAFLARVRAEAAGDPRVLLPGALYGEAYRELLANAAVYVHATEVGGTHPALLEAMGFGRPLVVHDTPENREAAGDAGLYVDAHDPESLAAGVGALLSGPGERERSGRAARARARELFLWDAVADSYEALLAGRRSP